MVSKKAKSAIDALSEQELRFEIERGRRSRFQRDNYAYLKVKLAELEKGREDAQGELGADTMRIFLSWSGHASYQVAEALRDWLRAVLPYTRPWLSAEDINKGARWANEIASALDESNFGIICVVPGNVYEPWLNFEAGAISKTLDVGQVAPLLIGVEQHEVEGPLAQFQSTVFNRADVLRLIESINAAHDAPIDREQVRRTFNACWRQLEVAIAAIELDEPQGQLIEEVEEIEEFEEGDNELDEIDEGILVFLAQNEGLTVAVSDIAQEINESQVMTTHHLRLLFEEEYVYDSHIANQETEYGLDDDGRAYLIENNLVE